MIKSTSLNNTKTTSMINNIKKATNEYILQLSNKSKRSSILNTYSLKPFPKSSRLQRMCASNNNFHNLNLSKGANRTMESNSSAKKYNSTQSSNYLSSFCLSTSSSLQQKLDFPSSSKKNV